VHVSYDGNILRLSVTMEATQLVEAVWANNLEEVGNLLSAAGWHAGAGVAMDVAGDPAWKAAGLQLAARCQVGVHEDLPPLAARVVRDASATSFATALGWAVVSWSSPELIKLLADSGAPLDTNVRVDSGDVEPLLAFLLRSEAAFNDPAASAAFLAHEQARWGRVPETRWFEEVKSLLAP